jgi:hypothetical protein
MLSMLPPAVRGHVERRRVGGHRLLGALTCFTARGRRPASAAEPMTEWVLPEPVWPYARIVPLYPCSIASTIDETCVYVSACVASGDSTESNVKELPASSEASETVRPSSPKRNASADCAAVSRALAGRKRATTRIFSPADIAPLVAFKPKGKKDKKIPEFNKYLYLLYRTIGPQLCTLFAPD